MHSQTILPDKVACDIGRFRVRAGGTCDGELPTLFPTRHGGRRA